MANLQATFSKRFWKINLKKIPEYLLSQKNPLPDCTFRVLKLACP
jgi:hypothetical protein